MKLIDEAVRHIETGYTQALFVIQGLADTADNSINGTNGLLAWLNTITVRNVGAPDCSSVLVCWRKSSGRPASTVIPFGGVARVPRSAKDVQRLLKKGVLRAVPVPSIISKLVSVRKKSEPKDGFDLLDDTAQPSLLARLLQRVLPMNQTDVVTAGREDGAVVDDASARHAAIDKMYQHLGMSQW